MNDPYCPTLDEINLTAEEQFVLDSMSVITDDELMHMRLSPAFHLVSFIENNHRVRNMVRMDPSMKMFFIRRRFCRNQKEEEERRMKEAELERQRQEQEEIKKKSATCCDTKKDTSAKCWGFFFRITRLISNLK